MMVQLVPLTLELGGKSPVIVGPNAKLKKSVDKIMMGKLVNAGQICIAPDYIFVPQNKEDEFVQHATDFVKSHYPTVRNNPDYTSIIHLNHYERLKELIRDAEEKGEGEGEGEEEEEEANIRQIQAIRKIGCRCRTAR